MRHRPVPNSVTVGRGRRGSAGRAPKRLGISDDWGSVAASNWKSHEEGSTEEEICGRAVGDPAEVALDEDHRGGQPGDHQQIVGQHHHAVHHAEAPDVPEIGSARQ